MPDDDLMSVGSRIAYLLAGSKRSTEEVAAATGISDVDGLVRGVRDASTDELLMIATYLDVPIGVLTGRTPLRRHLGVSLRLGVFDEAQDVREALIRAETLLDHEDVLASWGRRLERQSLGGFAVSLDRYARDAGKTTAERLRDYLGTGQGPISDLVTFVEQFGIPVAHEHLPSNVHGVSVRDERSGTSRWAVVVNTQDYWTRQRFTLGHELCHVLYRDEGQVIVDRVELGENEPEWRAESFARHLLIPVRGLRSFLRRRRLKTSVDIGACLSESILTWGVSREVVAYALVGDGHVSQSAIDAWLDLSVVSMMRKFGYEHEWARCVGTQHHRSVSPGLVEHTVHAFSDGLVDVKFVADLLGEPDTARMVAELAEAGWVDNVAPGAPG